MASHDSAASTAPLNRDYLSYSEIERDYPGTVKASTLNVWACTHRYNFHQLVTKVGRRSVVRRDRWEAFLDSRTIGSANGQ